MDNNEKTLPDVSSVQEIPFSTEVMALYQRWVEADKDERLAISLELASVFCADHDFTEDAYTEEYHSAFEDYHEAQLNFERESLRLSRLAVGVITGYLQEHNIDLNSVVLEKPVSN